MITNRESLKEKIHEIHNYMRNNGIGYGMNALKVFNFLYGLMKIEDYNQDLFEEKYRFSYLLKLANEDSKKTNEAINNIIGFIFNNEKLKPLIYYEIPDDLTHDVYNDLIKQIYSIKDVEASSNELLSGKVYEYFIGRDQSSISELGAYFTNRRIVDFILNKIDIQLKSDGSIPKMIDMFGGSGGFTTGYMNYLNDNFTIDWLKDINNIYHYDINEDVLNSARLELYCISNGIFPSENNIKKVNSFKCEFSSKFDLIITNPPYGGDKKITSAKKEKRDKVKAYLKKLIDSDIDEDTRRNRKQQLEKIKSEEKEELKQFEKQTVNIDTCSKILQQFASKNKLIGKDKEACSLMLMMELLENNGLAVGVLKEGLFFDGKYKDLRKFLIENYNLKAIISVPQNQFENTSTKTSIIIFEKGSITTKIEFSELIVNTYNQDEFIEYENEIHLSCCKGDIKNIEEIYINTVSKTDILNNTNYSFNSKDYETKSIICGDDFKLVKIGDISKIEFGTRITKKNNIIGIYGVLGGGDITFYTNEYNREGFNIIISRFALSSKCVRLINDKIFLNDSGLSLNIDNDNIKKYIGYYLYNNQYIIYNSSRGTIQNNIDITKLKELEIPIPKTQELIDYWVNKISTPFNLKQEKEKKFKELEEEIKIKIKDIQENSDCDEVKLGDISKFKDGYDFYRNEMDDRNKYIEGENLPLLKIANNEINDYIIINKKYDKFIVNYGDIVIGTKGSCGKIRKINIEKAYHKHGLLKLLDFKINKNYIYYYLLELLNIDYINKIINTSVLSNMKKSKLEEIKIKIPKDKSLIDNLEPLFNEVEDLQKEIKELDETYNNNLQELSKSAIKDEEIEIKEEIKNEDTNSNKSLTVNDLREQCKSLGIKGYSKKKKEELIEMIKNHKN